jgi:hypothetical protein
MKQKYFLHLIILSATLLSLTACTTAPYTEQFTFTGTIEELITEEKLLFDDRFLLVKEGGEGSEEFVYELPVDSFDDYEVGQEVEVVVFSNTDADVWDLQNLKFEITIMK